MTVQTSRERVTNTDGLPILTLPTNINDNSELDADQTYDDNAGNATRSNNVANPGIYAPEGDSVRLCWVSTEWNLDLLHV